MALTQTQQFQPGMGLTTTKAPFIEVARSRGELYIEQPYELYSEENHEAWRRLYARIQDRWQRYATEKFLEGVSKLCLDPNRVPRLDDVNRFLRLLFIFDSFDHLFTLGFSVLAVAGGGRVAVGVAVRVAGVGRAYLRRGLGSCRCASPRCPRGCRLRSMQACCCLRPNRRWARWRSFDPRSEQVYSFPSGGELCPESRNPSSSTRLQRRCSRCCSRQSRSRSSCPM
jgi:hypothetical protein